MKYFTLVWLVIYFVGCAPPLRTSIAPFRPPEAFSNAKTVWDLVIAADVLDTPEKSSRVFGTDLASARILPVHLLVSNKGSQEFEIDAAQIFGIAGEEFFPAYTLTQAAVRVRESSIGTTVATQAALGALALGAAGAAVGAGAGRAAGNTARGAAAGAAIGAGTGAAAGAAAGASDSYTNTFRHELAVQDFGSRNIFAGDLHRGFIYFERQLYTAIRIKITNVSRRETQVIELSLK